MQTDYNIIGAMSGTSLDGLDLAHIKLRFHNNQWNYQIYSATTIAYSIDWTNRLKNGINLTPLELNQLDIDYTELLATQINSFIQKNAIQNLDAVCSHGHTIHHQPDKGYTLQIGNLSKIAQLTNLKIICNFRVQDVVLGGQGAPLVPIGDRLLFGQYDYCLNLGGFANISFEEKRQRIAFDISPVNTVLNFYTNKIGLAYDDKGLIAQSGTLDKELLNQLNQVNYYNLPYPKSLGIEFVQEIILPIIEQKQQPIATILRTFTEHIAIQLAHALPVKKGQLLITGGGTFNEYLIERIQFQLPNIELVVPDSKTIEFKEAVLFGLLGILRLRNENNVLSSVTGASKDHSSGIIHSPITS